MRIRRPCVVRSQWIPSLQRAPSCTYESESVLLGSIENKTRSTCVHKSLRKVLMIMQPTTGTSTSTARILIVDSDPVIADLVSKYVGHYLKNASVFQAHSAGAACGLVDTSSAWAFVVDTDLPDREGELLVWELLERCPRAIAVLTGSKPRQFLEHPNLLMSLIKPYDVDILTSVLCAALKRLDASTLFG